MRRKRFIFIIPIVLIALLLTVPVVMAKPTMAVLWSLDGNTGIDDTIHFLGTNDAMDLVIKTDSVEKMRIESGGNVGIGTSSPNNLLDLGTTLGKKLAIYQIPAGTDFYGLGISGGTLEIHAGSDVADPPQMVVEASGNVGIGDTTPDTALEVLDTATPQFRLTHTDGVDDVDFSIDSDGDFDISISGNNFVIQNESDGTTGFQVLDSDGGTPILNVDTTNERVGIGTAAPAAKLDVSTSLVEDAIRAETSADGTNAVFGATSGDDFSVGVRGNASGEDSWGVYGQGDHASSIGVEGTSESASGLKETPKTASAYMASARNPAG